VTHNSVRTETWAHRMLLAAMYAGLVFLVMLISPVSSTGSDSYGELLVSQAILRDHTVRLDPYRDYFRLPDGSLHQAAAESGGHLYNYFPIGTALIALPAVAAVNAAGLDVRDVDRALQKALAALASALLALVIYAIAREFFSRRASLLWSAGAIFGTVIGPTIGTALWSIDFELLFTGLVILYLVRIERSRRTYPAWLLGLFLFLGYLCRPTMAPLVALTLGYLLWQHRRQGAIAALVSGGLMVLFALWSLHTFSSLLPPYYAGSRLSLSFLPAALWGSIISPSRSLLIWNPVLLALPLLFLLPRRPSPVLWLLWLTGALDFLTVITFPHWWVGHSFGPRGSSSMMLVAMAAVIVTMGTNVAQASRGVMAAVAGLLLFGVAINIQGLYNPYAMYWNAYPDVGLAPDKILFDWRYPQFYVTAGRLREKYATQSRELGLPADKILPVRGMALLLSGDAAADFWIGRTPAAAVSFTVVTLSPSRKTVTVSLNGHYLGTVGGKLLSTATFAAKPDWMKLDAQNRLAFSAAGGAAGTLLSYRLR